MQSTTLEATNYHLFPTTVSRTESVVSELEKDLWFKLYLKHSASDGRSHDFLGFETVQTDELFHDLFMNRLKQGVDGYLKHLNISRDNLDVQLTKCFFNVTDKSAINLHDHAENHISFTYYPHVAKDKDRNLVFHNPTHSNEPYQNFFIKNCKEWTEYNCLNDGLPVSEGVMYVFPSKMLHDIEMRQDDIPSEVLPFTSKESLRNSRFCVAGDLLYTRKVDVPIYSRLLSSPENWRKVYE